LTDKNIIKGPLNLTKTQNGYVPLSDRFKSFPADSQKEPHSDAQFYFENYANSTLEHADIGLLFPTPKWLRKRLNKQGLVGAYRVTVGGKLRISNTIKGARYRVSVESK